MITYGKCRACAKQATLHDGRCLTCLPVEHGHSTGSKHPLYDDLDSRKSVV